jgi:hypothetical protein
MTVSLHTVEAWLGTRRLPVISATITLDEAWAPYAQATLELPLDMQLLGDVDPRLSPRIKVWLVQKYGVSDPLSYLSTSFAGSSVSAFSSAWSGSTLGDISAYYFAPYNASGSKTLATFSDTFGGQNVAAFTTARSGDSLSQISSEYFTAYPSLINSNNRRRFDFTLRTRSLDITGSRMTLDLSSNEALLQDYALVEMLPFSPGVLDLRLIVQGILARIGDYLSPGVLTATIPSESAIWLPGQSAWDYLTPLIQAAGLRLYCDEKRNWYLVDAAFIAPGIVELRNTATITAASDTISRDSNVWYDAVVITYSWIDDLGETVLSYDTAAVEGFSKVYALTYNTAYPGPGAAAAVLARALTRGRMTELRAVSNFQVTPAQPAQIVLDAFPTQDAFVSAVSWTFPEDEMTVTTRTTQIGI